MACPCFSLIPLSKLFKEHSISSSSGGVVNDELAKVVVSGLKALEEGWLESDSDDVSVIASEDVSMPLELVISVHELPVDQDPGNEHEDSLVVVLGDSVCKLAV